MDRHDLLYLGGSLLIAGGAAVYSWPAGLIVFGAALLLPAVMALLEINRKGPDK